MKWFFVLSFFSAIGFSCVENERIVNFDDGRQFYPLSVNSFWEYEIERINYDAAGPDTVNSFLRELVIDSIPVEEGYTEYLIQTFTRLNNSDPWMKSKQYTVRQSSLNTINQDNGISVVNQIYPVSDQAMWNANVRNNRTPKTFEYQLGIPDTLLNNALYSDNIKVIIDEEEINLTAEIERFEIYSKGIGLIIRNYKELGFNTIENDPNQGQIETGFILKQSILSYGK